MNNHSKEFVPNSTINEQFFKILEVIINRKIRCIKNHAREIESMKRPNWLEKSFGILGNKRIATKDKSLQRIMYNINSLRTTT